MNRTQYIEQISRNIKSNENRIESLKNEIEMLEVQNEGLTKLKDKKEKEAK